MNIDNTNQKYFSYIPLCPNTKRPQKTGWQNKGVDLESISGFGKIPDDINVGILTGAASGGLIDVDLDGPCTIEAGALILPFTGMIMGRDSRPRSHWFYLIEGSAKTITFKHPTTGEMLVEFRGDGCQTMMPPSMHPDDGETVRFESGKDGSPAFCDRETLVVAIRRIATVSVLAEFWIEGGRHDLAKQFAGLCACNGVTREACEAVINALVSITADEEWDDRIRAIATTYDRVAEAKPVEWRAGLTELLGERKAVTVLIEWMTGNKLGSTSTDPVKLMTQSSNNSPSEKTMLDTDVAIAEWFEVCNSGRLIFSDRENQFYKNKNDVYEAITATEAKGDITDFLKGPACNGDSVESDKRRSLQSVSKINSTFEITKTMLRVDDRLFDKDDHLLGTENGIIDLSTFKLINTDEIVTKRIGTKYLPDAECSSFLEFLDQVMEDDRDTINYIQRILGYTLTGSVEAQVMFILTGKGANGKSVLLKLISALMGTYGAAVPAHTITQPKFSNDKTDDLASLTGKRFVVASEGDAGDRLAVAKIKRMVAGDPISVRKLYGSYFDLQPKFKLWFGSNELPEVSGTDYAIWRRIHVIQFPRTFEPHERDPKLVEKLKVELPGILNWALDGLRQMEGMKGDFLAPPVSVLRSIEEYRSDNDNVSKFISDRCVKEPGASVSMGDLYNSYKGWCFENAADPTNNNVFGKDLTSLGFQVIKRSNGNARRGLRLK